MRTRDIILTVTTIISLSACTPSVTTNAVNSSSDPLPFQEKVEVIYLAQSVPEGAVILGTVKIGDTGFTTKCEFEYVVELATQEARKIGGNAIKIREHNTPDFWSTCHRITADILNIKK